MADKMLDGRIVHKHDTEVNWLKANFIPRQGELVVYDIDETYNYERLKIGDGITYVSDLPFVDKQINKALDNKVDKIKGKGLSTEDYTTAEKEMLANLNTLVGNKSVSEQIETAVSSINSPVTSVNGKVGDVQLTASDIGADVSGSADAALESAQDYTDTQLSVLIGNATVSTQINEAVATKADKSHTHTAEDLDPFEVIGSDTLTWDGNTAGHLTFDPNDGYGDEQYFYVKLSDSVPTVNDVQLMHVYSEQFGDMWYEGRDEIFNEDGFCMFYGFYIVPFDNYEDRGVVYPEKGCYTQVSDRLRSVTIYDYEGFGTAKLKEKYLQIDETLLNTMLEEVLV